jgi:hypothetical protein
MSTQQLAEYWKSILAFLSLVATNVATQLMTSGVPWPTNGGEWARFGATTVLGTWLVFQKANAPKAVEPTAP